MFFRIICTFTIVALSVLPAEAGPREKLITDLNTTESMDVSDDGKSWREFFDACLSITPPPTQLSDSFNMNTIWPRMVGWAQVSKWASENEHMEDVFIQTTRKAIIGLPYGKENVPDEYGAANLVADIGVGGNLNDNNFGYIEMVKLACLWATAESYVLLEEGETNRALYLMMSEMLVLSKFCDREFLKEKITFMEMLGDALSNTRDMFYTYRAEISPSQFRRFAMDWLPNIRTAPTSLLMPLGDQMLSEVLLEELFNSQGMADAAKFNEILTQMQLNTEPLSGFGATKFWTSMADLHRGKLDSVKRMNMIYDDWWRRWKLRLFHPMLSTPTKFENANSVNYAAVKMIVKDTQELFKERRLLITQINGTIVSAALCGFFNQFGEFPTSIKKTYAQFMHRANNMDPMRKNEMRIDSDWELYIGEAGKFHYRLINKTIMIKTLRGNIPIEKGECFLYGQSKNEEDDGGLDADLDTVIWPPLKSLERNAGLLN